MRCMHPLTLIIDNERQFVPCGKCNFCLETRRAHWSFRLAQELKVSTSAHFLTLTYDDKKIPFTPEGVSTLRKDDVQRFIKRLRRLLEGQSIRYYAVGEYGTRTIRPHYHVLAFNIQGDAYNVVDKTWGLGNIMVGTVTEASIHYVTKYHVNVKNEYPGREPPFALMSRKPGIGANYFLTHSEWHMYSDRLYTQVNGFTRSLPRYYRVKMFENRLVDLSKVPCEVEEYAKEIERLSKLHPNPLEYYNERRRHAHDNVKHKSNKNDIF